MIESLKARYAPIVDCMDRTEILNQLILKQHEIIEHLNGLEK